MIRLLCVLSLLLVAACSSGPASGPIRRGATSPDSVSVVPVKNLSGVSVVMPEVYFGDNSRLGAELDIDDVDMRLLVEAALLGQLRRLGYNADSAIHADNPRFEAHVAIRRFDMDRLRREGRITIALSLFVIRTEDQAEITQSDTEDTFQLLDQAPDEAGVLGEQRFIRERLELFSEFLAESLLAEAGL